MIKSGSASELYLAAGKAELAQDRSRAKALYQAVTDRFPNDALAIKAIDGLTALARTESIEASNAAAAAEVARAREASEAQLRAQKDAEAQAHRCSHVYIGQRINQSAFWGMGLVIWEVVGISTASEQLTLRDTSGGLGTKEISCGEAAYLIERDGK